MEGNSLLPHQLFDRRNHNIMKLYKLPHYLTVILIISAFMSGCATQVSHFRLDSSLEKDIRNFSGSQYIPLAKLCDTYGLNYKWDTFARSAVIEKGANRIALRPGSDTVIVNGRASLMDRPVVLNGGEVFVPVSFARDTIGPIIGVLKPGRAIEIEAPKRVMIRTIVLDPGHGGKDPGALGRHRGTREKDMTLALARKVKDRLEQAGIRVVMTRDDDTFIPLQKRADIANHINADLFVSIHINSSRSHLMRGFECYYLSNATDDNARALEAFEDSSLKTDKEADIEHSSRLDKTLWDMTLTEDRRESSELAGMICSSIDNSFTVKNRGIRSARFYVLKHTHMPSVLVETAYISNRYEEMKLRDPRFLDRMADAITEGILKYKKEFERTEGFSRI